MSVAILNVLEFMAAIMHSYAIHYSKFSSACFT